MKLHLPKQLFTALLAAITLTTPASLTLGSTAWGADQTLTEDITWDAANTTTAGTSDTIFVGSGDGGTNKEIKLTIADGADITAHMLALRRGGDVQITGGTLTLNRLHIHNHNDYTGKELFELSGGVVTVNGGDDFTNSATGSRTAITIGHWGGGSGRLLVSGGTLNSLNGSIYMGFDSSAELEITGGTVNAKGFYYRTDVNRTSSVRLNGGRLNIGTQGINNSRIEDKGNRTVTLTSGTLGVLNAAGWTLQNVDTTIGNITIDTNTWDAATGATATGDAAGSANISLLGNLKAAEGGMNITLAGNGSITIDHTLHGTVTLAENAEARLYYDASNLNNYDKVLSGIGSTGASGFLLGYQIIGAGSDVSVYAEGSDTAVTLTNGAVMLDAATDLYVRDELAYDGTTMGGATHYYIEEGGVFDFTGYDLGTEDAADSDKKLIAIMNKMSGAGTVKLASGATIQTQNDRTAVMLTTNYSVAGGADANLTLTSWKYDAMSDWRTWQVDEGGSITVGNNGEGTLNILAGQRLSIQNGGQVSVGTLKLGYDGTTGNKDNPGSLVMSGRGSSLTVGGIVMQNGIDGTVLNEVNITGGTLKVTGATAITYNADNVKTAVTLGGSDAESSVLLQTGTTTGWVMSKQANAASTFNVGYVTIDGTNTQSITFNGATLTGVITNNASLILSEDVVWNSGATVSNNGTLQINKGTGDLVLNNIVGVNAGTYKPAVVTNTTTGNLIIANTGNKTLNSNITISNGGKVTLKGGTFGTADAAITHTITGENNTTLVLDDVEFFLSRQDSDEILQVDVHLTNGAVMHMLANDRLDWGGTFAFLIGLNSQVDVGSYRQSLSGDTLDLAGGTIYGSGGNYPSDSNAYTAGLDYHATGTISATENSLIATAIAAREHNTVVTLDVAPDKTLTIGSYTSGDSTYNGAFVGQGSFNKTGNGTVIYKGAAFTNALTISGGVFEYYLEEEREHTGSISGTGTFKKSGNDTLTLTNSTVANLIIAGGKLVYNSSADTNITISSVGGTTFEKTGSGTLTANTSDLAGELLISEGTLKVGSAMENENRRATVANGATLDLNGYAAYYNLTLQGGATLTNTCSEAEPDSTGVGMKQLHTITLEGNAKVTGTSQFGMVGSGWGQTTLNLNGNTLTKEGANTLHFFNTRVQSGGLIQVNEGKVITHSGKGSGTLDLTRASIGIAGGEFELGGNNQSIQDLTLTSGSLIIGSGLTLTALGDVTMSSGTVSGNLCLSGTIALTGDGTNTVDLSSAVLSGTSLSGFTLLESASPTTSGLQSLTYQLWSGEGSVDSSQSTISVGGVDYTMKAATGTFSTAGTVYYVAAGDTITVGGDSAGEGTASATSFVVDGSLSVSADTSTESINGTAGTVSVAEATTLTLTGTSSSIGTLSAANASVALAAGSTLHLGQTGADAQETTSSIGTVNVNSGAGTIYLNENAKLNRVVKSGGSSLTLAGSGQYILSSLWQAPSTSLDYMGGVALSSAWTGTVKISDSHIMGVNLNSMGNANSSVLLNGLGTWIHTSHTTINTNLILENFSESRSAFIITDNSATTYTFNGKVSGTGDFELSTRSAHSPTFAFAGDTSDWSGGIIVNTSYNGTPYTTTANNTPTFTVALTGGGDVFAPEGADGVSMNRGGTMTLQIGKAGVETRMNGAITKMSDSTLNLTVLGDTVFNKAVNVSKLTLNENTSATLSRNTHIIDSFVANTNSELILSSGAIVTMGANQEASMNLTSLKNLQLIGAEVTWQSSNSTVQKLDVRADSFWTIKDMSADATLTINSVSVADDTTLTVNKNGAESWNQNLNIGELTGDGNVAINGPGSADVTSSSLVIGSLAEFGGDLTISCHEEASQKVYNTTVNTGTTGTTMMGTLQFSGYGQVGETSTAVFNVQSNTSLGTLNASGVTVNIENNVNLTLGGGTVEAQKEHCIGTLTTAAGSGISLGDYATLQINDIPSALKDDYGSGGNTDSDSSLQLAIGGGTGSVLELALSARPTNNTDWLRNNTVTLSTLTGAAGGVGEVYISSGSLANAVFAGNATTNLNGAALRMADGTSIILRKANSGENLGAGDITLEGTTELYNYGINSTLTNNISGGTLNITNEGTVTLTGNVNLQAFQMGIDTILGDGVNERSYTLGTVTVTSAKTLTVSKNATLNRLSNDAQNLKLAGEGVYNLGSNKTSNVSGLTDSTKWTGTVVITGLTGDQNDLHAIANSLANSNSTLKLCGVEAWLSNNYECDEHFELENVGETSALKLNNGYSNTPDAAFSGSIQGSGDMEYVWIGGADDGTIKYTFSADTSLWYGKFISSSGKLKVTADFTKRGDVFSATQNGGGIVNNSLQEMTVEVGSSEGEITFNGTISKNEGKGDVNLNVKGNTSFEKSVTVSCMTVDAGKTATVNATLSANTASNNGSLKLGTAATVTGGSMANVMVQSSGISAASITDGAKGNISSAHIEIAQLQEDASFTIRDMTLTNTTVTAAAPTTEVNFSNVTVNGSFVLNVAAATTMTEPTVGAGGAEGTAGTITYSYDLGLSSATAANNTITLNLDVLNAIAPSQSGQYTLVVELTNFDDSVFGSVDEGTWKSLVGFQEGSWLAEAITVPTVAPDGSSTTPTVSYGYTTGGDGSNVGRLTITISGLNVPEPATSTLSLLALAALAARRRRK